jgi:hypothetical protein
MRHLAAIALASLAAIACGTASPDRTEPSASTGADLINPVGGGSCYSGYVNKCQFMNGHELCGCVPLSCNWDVPTGLNWVESWSVGSSDGSCPDIKAPTGTWKELSIVQQGCPFGFGGVPCEAEFPSTAQECNPNDFGTPHCCTYVWWPTGYAPPACPSPGEYDSSCTNGAPSQFPQVLCTHAGMTFKALGPGSVFSPDAGIIFIPGKGGCSTCAP